jgi:hypothetical protein
MARFVRPFIRVRIAIGIAAGLLGACDPERPAEPTAGTNTNWMSHCSSNADCVGGISCLCGVCTKACSTTADCAGSNGSCAEPLSTLIACHEPNSAPLCLAVCTFDGDCPSNELCVQGTCSLAPSGTTCASDANTLLCGKFDGVFESPWQVVLGGGGASLTPVSTPAFSGTGALQADWPNRAVLTGALGPITDGSVYGRLWLRVASDPLALRMHGPELSSDSSTPALRLVIDGESLWLENETGQIEGSTRTFGRDVWHCIRFEIAVSDTAGHLAVYLDEGPMIELSAIDTLPGTGISQLSLGINWANADTRVFVDDVLLRRVPVGCIGE